MWRSASVRRIDAQKLPKVELTNADLPRVVNGRPGDPVEMRAFSRAFAPEKVRSANLKVGAVPLTRAALKNPKVRVEIEVGDDAPTAAQRVADEHAKKLAAARELGLNTDTMSAKANTADCLAC